MAGKTRPHNIHFMVTADERDMIERRMKQSGIKNMRSYLFKMAVDGRVIRIEFDSVKEMCRLLGNTANNVNQIARRANQTGNIYAADLEELALRYDELLLQSKVVLKKISAMKV